MPLGRVVRDDLEANRSRFAIALAAARITAPWLVVHGGDDTTVRADEARTLARRGLATELVMLEGSGHTFEAVHPFDRVTPGLEAAIDATVQHFGASLAPAADDER